MQEAFTHTTAGWIPAFFLNSPEPGLLRLLDNTTSMMNRLIAISLITAVTAISAHSAHAAPLGAKAAHSAVSPVELRKLFPGRFSAIVKGYQVRFVASASGRLTGHYGAMTDKGRWSLRGTKLCVMLKDWLDGKTTCARVRREKDQWFRASGIRFRKM